MKATILAAALLLATAASLHAADRKPFSSAKETDARLHADGKGWGLDKAKVVDPARPRVILMGDSILSGYHKHVLKALEGRAYVDVWIHPYCQSDHLNRILAEVLDEGPYDVVHFNMGLHGWQPGRIKEGTFEPLTRAFVEVIRTKLPKARIIWASSTPVLKGGATKALDPEINATIVEHNRMAAGVMNELKVPINDFHALLVGRLELARGGRDKFHWNAPAYKILAETAVDSIRKALPDQPPARKQ
jgi:hypothetical protein